MNKEDIKVGQVYSWRRTPEKRFKIVDIVDGQIIWYSFESDRVLNAGYAVAKLLRCLIGNDAFLVEDVNQKPIYRMDKFRFV